MYNRFLNPLISFESTVCFLTSIGSDDGFADVVSRPRGINQSKLKVQRGKLDWWQYFYIKYTNIHKNKFPDFCKYFYMENNNQITYTKIWLILETLFHLKTL